MEVLIVLLIMLTIITLIGHGIWVAIRAFIRLLVRNDDEKQATRLFTPVAGPLDDLAAFERQLVRFSREGKINDEIYELLLVRIRAERDRLLGRQTTPPQKPAPAPAPPAPPAPPSVVPPSAIASDDQNIVEPAPTFLAPEEPVREP